MKKSVISDVVLGLLPNGQLKAEENSGIGALKVPVLSSAAGTLLANQLAMVVGLVGERLIGRLVGLLAPGETS